MPINPRIAVIHLDSCAFDPKYGDEQQAANDIFEISNNSGLIVQIAHSTQREIDHPNTPAWVKKRAADGIFTMEVQLTPSEVAVRDQIWAIITGNGKPENYRADAEHVFEAQKYGSYFVTTDQGILDKSGELRKVCQIEIIKPTQLLALLR